MKKKAAADFRYNTGAAKIPWAAVGEPIASEDVLEMVRFLLPPSKDKKVKYSQQLKKVAGEIKRLGACSSPAGKLSLGNQVQELEAKAARMLKAKHTLFLTNATAGFEIGFQFAGLQPGDEVIAPAITFIATIAYPLSIGAKVVIADVNPRTLNMDPKDVKKKLTRKTKAIIPVHIGGYPADLDPIMRLARKHNITVIEDAAHAYGAMYKGRMVGTLGHFGAFSFHEVKNINALGEGGLLVTNTPHGKDFAKARFLGVNMAKQIPNWLYDVTALKGRRGWFAPGNHSATEIQALNLLLQSKRLKNIIAKRKKAAQYLTSRFRKVEGIITPPADTAKTRSTHHLYLLQVDPAKAGGDIQKLKKKLDMKGVVNIPHFAPLYKFSIMQQLGYNTKAIAKTCPVAEEAFNHRFTHLPLYDFKQAELKYLADAVISSVKEMQSGK
ncbi:MAG: DegT/DnrJ/EryC1/StrS family aminotransferase [Planctomycetes bacterium]|nr:DegT/DnrJ/EryC1/StrS family aminotransferase [Planctomycetota bacterium]